MHAKHILHPYIKNTLLAAISLGFLVVIFFLAPQTAQDITIAPENRAPQEFPAANRDITPKKDLPLVWKVPDIERMKNKGCVADGLLSGYNSPKNDLPLARESNCYYFHRALETWRSPPDFQQAHEAIKKINRPDALYGMFIAEAINQKAEYIYRAEKREFEFKEMCRSGSKNYWGEHTCKPSLKKEEYRAYLKQITEDAMDSGIQVFLFGQIDHQEENILHPKIDNVIEEMKAYAKSINMEIVVGAQTGDITNKKYLNYFDFIEGGIGVRPDGKIESGPCFSKYYQKEGDWCWPMMWHSQFADRAEHIFVYMDWNGQIGDDMSTFAQMPNAKRHQTLRDYRAFFTAPQREKIGFLLPLLAPLPKENNGGCHGSRLNFYSPHNQFGCRDIDVINELLSDNISN